MAKNQQSHDSFVEDSVSLELSWPDITNFLSDSWQKLTIAAIMGSVLGFGGWFLLGGYQAQLALANNDGISILFLKSLQQTLPNLAAQGLEKRRVPEGQEALYRTMTNPDWWKKAVTPVYSLTKADIKDMGSEMKEISNPILFLMVNGEGGSKVAAIQNAEGISKFIHTGGAYLALESLLRSQEAQLLIAQSDIEAKINNTLVELEYQQARLRSLEVLAKRFPGESRANPQVVDPKDAGAKYLPISTQIIAINTDINSSMEGLERLRDRRLQLGGLKDWLADAEPIIAQGFNGLELNRELLALEKKHRASITQADPKSLAFLDSVRTALIANEARFRFGLVESPNTLIKKSGMIKSIVAGLAGAFFIMLLVLVWQRAWGNIKCRNK